MMLRYFLVVVLLFVACHTARKTTVVPAEQNQAASMSCKVQGLLIDSWPSSQDKHEACGKYPCMGKVKILRVYNCGSAVLMRLQENDTVTIFFNYTLHATKDSYPTLNLQLPGLNNSDIFTANVEEHIAPGKKAALVVYGYEKNN